VTDDAGRTDAGREDAGDDEAEPDGAPDLAALVERVPPGWTEVAYAGVRWGLSRTDRAGGASTSLYAERLGGPGVVSANVWRTRDGEVLRPCEMPASDVLDFLRGWKASDPDRSSG
jgi:hypothetical protein